MSKFLAQRFMARVGMAGVLASVMLCMMPVFAQDSPLSLADRVSLLERAQQNQDKNGINMVNQAQQLQAQMQQLQGQIEILQHQLQQQSEQSQAQYIDLDSRLSRLEKSPAPAATKSPGQSVPPPIPVASTTTAKEVAKTPVSPKSSVTNISQSNNSSPKKGSMVASAAYAIAFNDLRQGNYAKASNEFRAFLERYPNNTLSPNALYWLAQTYYVTMDYPIALETFQKTLQLYPQSLKAPDALLKIGYTQYKLKQVEAAKDTLHSVMTKYPGSKAASLARDYLRLIQTSPAS